MILAMCVGQMPTNLRDWTGFLLYPGGIVVGLILAYYEGVAIFRVEDKSASAKV